MPNPNKSSQDNFSTEELRSRLTHEQFRVTQQKGTEAPFTGELLQNKQSGDYHCVVCGAKIFSSETKYNSGSGWPSFYDVTNSSSVHLVQDDSLGMKRTEVMCSNCGAHLGHVFPDGPQPTGQRYCINSAALDFQPETKSSVDE